MRETDPDALVVCGGLAYDVEFIRTLFREHGASPYVDVVNIHNYFETWSGAPLENIVGYVNEVHDVISRYGSHQAVWMAEVGYSTFRKNGYVSDQYSAYYDYEHTPPYQAVHLIRTLTLLLSTGKLSAIAWYEIKDLPTSEDVIGDVNNRHLGVAYVDYTPKPAERGLSFFDKLFAGKSRCIDKEVRATRPVASDSEIHCFEIEDGSVIIVAWLKTHVPGRRGDLKGGNVRDVRKESVELTLPYSLTGKATLYDELGNERVYGNLERNGSTTRVKDLTLVGGQVAIIKIEK